MTSTGFDPIRSLKRILKQNAAFYHTYVKLRLLLQRDPRYRLARRYLRGSGIEIGGLHLPLPVPFHAEVAYVDRMPLEELRPLYPELKESVLVRVDIVDDAETLETIRSESQDFVIANHVLEHCANPLRALESFFRVLKPGGILYLTVPDKRFTFDADRPITPLEHVVRDYTEGPERSREEHLRAWRQLVDEKFTDDLRRDAETMKGELYSIHFHVWTQLELWELVLYARRTLGILFDIQAFAAEGQDCIFILRKT